MKHRNGQSFGPGIKMGYGRKFDLEKETYSEFSARAAKEREAEKLAPRNDGVMPIEAILADQHEIDTLGENYCQCENDYSGYDAVSCGSYDCVYDL